MNHLAAIDAMTHAEIYEAVNRGPGGGAAMHVEDAWRKARSIIVAADERTRAAIAASAGAWEGGAADAARSGLSSLNDWLLEAIGDAQNTATSLTGQGFDAGELRNGIPRPHAYELFDAQSAAQLNPADRTAADRAARAESTAQDPQVQAQGDVARDRLNQYVINSYERLHAMSIWTVPPVITVDTTGAAPSGPAAGPGPGVPDLRPVGPAGAETVAVPAGGASGAPVPGGTGPNGHVLQGVPLAPGGTAPAGHGPAGVVPNGVPQAGAMPGSGVPGVGVPGAAAPSGTGPGAGGRPAPSAGAPLAGRTEASRLLPPGAGGRGARSLPTPTRPPVTGVQPVVPRPPAPVAPGPNWRSLVANQPGGSPPTGTGGPGAGRSAGGFVGARPDPPPAPRPEVRVAPGAEPARGAAGGGSHGMYPPMGASGAGPQGQDRRRAPFLVDDSGAFDVSHVPCVDPVIGEPEMRG